MKYSIEAIERIIVTVTNFSSFPKTIGKNVSSK